MQLQSKANIKLQTSLALMYSRDFLFEKLKSSVKMFGIFHPITKDEIDQANIINKMYWQDL